MAANSYVKVLTPGPQIVTLFGDRAFKVVSEVRVGPPVCEVRVGPLVTEASVGPPLREVRVGPHPVPLVPF